MNTTSHKTAKETEQLSLFPVTPKNDEVALNTVYQYFFVINLPPSLSHSVKQLKQKLHKSVNLSDYNLYATPNITLMSFHTMRPVNNYFIESIRSLLSKTPYFDVKINGFDNFEHGSVSNTFYAKIENSSTLSNLYKELHNLLGLKIRSYTPHLTIARSIPRSKFEKIHPLFKDKEFDAQFCCEHITILQRTIEYGTTSRFSVLKEFELKQLPHLKLAA